MTLTDDDFRLMRDMWVEFADTQEIADIIGLPEYQIYNSQGYRPPAVTP